jgi:hypothetical protein
MTNALGIAGSLEVGDRALSRHNIKAPSDVMIGQYSIPFCTALALVGEILPTLEHFEMQMFRTHRFDGSLTVSTLCRGQRPLCLLRI